MSSKDLGDSGDLVTEPYKEFPMLLWCFGTYANSESVSLVGKEFTILEPYEIYPTSTYIVASVNLDGIKIPPSKEYRMFPYVSIKEYSENAGITELLQHFKVIEKDPVAISTSGFVQISTYKLHNEMLKYFGAIAK